MKETAAQLELLVFSNRTPTSILYTLLSFLRDLLQGRPVEKGMCSPSSTPAPVSSVSNHCYPLALSVTKGIWPASANKVSSPETCWWGCSIQVFPKKRKICPQTVKGYSYIKSFSTFQRKQNNIFSLAAKTVWTQTFSLPSSLFFMVLQNWGKSWLTG